MAKKIDRDWSKNRIHIWKKDLEGNRSDTPPPLLPPPPPPSKPSYYTSSAQPQHRLGNEWEERSSKWKYNPFVAYGDDPGWTSVDRNVLETQEVGSPAGWYDAADRMYSYPEWPHKQTQIVAVMQDDRGLVKRSRSREHSHDQFPPPPPRLDFPVEARGPNLEYRRVDEHDDDPPLRAEFYPLDKEHSRRKVSGQRHVAETIEILPERSSTGKVTSEMNLTPVQKVKIESRMRHGYDSTFEDQNRQVKNHMDGHHYNSTLLNRKDGREKLDTYKPNSSDELLEGHMREAKENYEVVDRSRVNFNPQLRDSRDYVTDRRHIGNENYGRRPEIQHQSQPHERRGYADEYQDGYRGDVRREESRRDDYRRSDIRRDDYIRDDSRREYIRRSDSRRGEKVSYYGGFEKERTKPSLTIQKGLSPRAGSTYEPKSDVLRKRSGEGRGSVISKKGSKQYEKLREDSDYIKVEKRDSIMLPSLEESEKEFHELVAAGDVPAVRAFLEDHPGFNINCTNYQSISALHVAVHESNEAMVEFLLEQPGLDCTDCALYAIKEGNVKIVEKILDKIKQTSPHLEYAAIEHSSDFPDDMTPIILAAQLGNYEIIDFLIKRDHKIPPVHNPYCKCETCKAELKKYDRLKYSTMKLNLYKAICNPMYIFHVTDDPFQRAFDLTQELQDAAKVFPQFKSSYEELWKEMRNFTVELISCCRNAQEVEIILKKSANNIAGSVTFPRLQYAIDLKQKEFVSHPYTQAVLVDAWTGDLLEWKVRSPLMQALAVFPRIPMLPVMAVMCMFLPSHSLVKKWKTPVNKLISSVASYLIFLIILFLESNLDKTNQKRGPPDSGLEAVIVIYVIGYIWLNIRLCFRLGPKRFFSTMWHWFDCIMLFLFTMTIVFWMASLADVTANNEIDLPRKYWNALDPELIAEGFFAAAVIMAFFRLNMFLSLNYHLGPLQVSIGKMTLDIFRFIIIFFIIILAWCAGLCRFYQPYDGMVQKDAASGSTTTQVSSFVSFSMTLKTFFWAIFGMSPIESADVVIENLPGDTPDTTIINHHTFTEAVGYIAFALFQFLSVVVVLNMLVACMANTFTKVIDNVTVEWVFGRSQIYLSFMAASTLPPPFNLLPTAAGIKSTLHWLKLLAKPSNGQRAKYVAAQESETEPYVNTEFPALMSQLAQRYVRLKGEDIETHDDLEVLKSEVKELLRKMDKVISKKCWNSSGELLYPQVYNS